MWGGRGSGPQDLSGGYWGRGAPSSCFLCIHPVGGFFFSHHPLVHPLPRAGLTDTPIHPPPFLLVRSWCFKESGRGAFHLTATLNSCHTVPSFAIYSCILIKGVTY